jgi:hypothetical protein
MTLRRLVRSPHQRGYLSRGGEGICSRSLVGWQGEQQWQALALRSGTDPRGWFLRSTRHVRRTDSMVPGLTVTQETPSVTLSLNPNTNPNPCPWNKDNPDPNHNPNHSPNSKPKPKPNPNPAQMVRLCGWHQYANTFHQSGECAAPKRTTASKKRCWGDRPFKKTRCALAAKKTQPYEKWRRSSTVSNKQTTTNDEFVYLDSMYLRIRFV